MDAAAAAQPAAFPPPPWRLKGELRLAAWLTRTTPPPPVPAGWRPVRLGGRLAVGAVWAAYGPQGDLAYRELAIGVLIRRGAALALTVPWIWVDSGAACDGGRRLWAIRKRLASFGGSRAQLPGGPTAELAFDRRSPPLGRVGLRLTVVQPARRGPVVSHGRIAGRLRLGSSSWRLPTHRGRPIVSAALEDAELVFGL